MAISNIWGMAKLEVGKKVGRVGTPLEAKLGIYTTSKALGMVVEGGRESINNTLTNTSFRSFYFQMRVHLKACKISSVNRSCMDEFSYKHILITDTSFVITPLLNPNFQFGEFPESLIAQHQYYELFISIKVLKLINCNIIPSLIN